MDGLVNRPSSFTLQDIRQLPARSQITRHDCVEGWSCIGGWTGPPLSVVLERVGLKPEARFVVFHCADELPLYTDGRNPYESIDLIDAYHPQTILAYDLNGTALDVAHGAPLRLRLERQLGYKMASSSTGSRSWLASTRYAAANAERGRMTGTNGMQASSVTT